VLDKSLHSSIVTRIKVLAHLRTDEHLDAQDGKMRMNIDSERVDIRVSVIPTTEGEKIVMRLLTSRFKSFSLSDLGMRKDDLEKIHEAINKSFGCVLATGPTGSGKTTSIYALLKILNTRDKNIMTIEDPVEYRVKGVNHIPVNPRAGLTFANGLRSILRQDPNVIFVGEIRDSETADIAVNAALTGHLVLSTLHTNDAATALPRLIDMKIEPFLIASTVNVIVAQRLVRQICVVCKEEVHLERKFMRKDISSSMLDKYFGRKNLLKIYKGKGCKICHNTGFFGRVGLFEVLEVSDKIRQLIIEKADASLVRKQAILEGMVPMLDDGLAKVAEGTTTLEEVLRVIKAESK
jgi:type II secretory ATPase GspE/PulE/Tfp pilus assembly ATPase PilB-like protein